MPTLLPHDGVEPDVKQALFIAETASIIGDVKLGPGGWPEKTARRARLIISYKY